MLLIYIFRSPTLVSGSLIGLSSSFGVVWVLLSVFQEVFINYVYTFLKALLISLYIHTLQSFVLTDSVCALFCLFYLIAHSTIWMYLFKGKMFVLVCSAEGGKKPRRHLCNSPLQVIYHFFAFVQLVQICVNFQLNGICSKRRNFTVYSY